MTMKDNDHNPRPDPLKARPVSVQARELRDGTTVWPVPSDILPPDRVMVFGHSAAEDHTRILDIVLTLPRAEVEEYAAFLCRHGAIDREPTAEEVTTMLQLAGNQMIQYQMELMARFSDFLIDRLGTGDRDEARDACCDSIASQIASEAIKANAIDPAEADETKEAIRKAIQAFAERMADNARPGSDEITGKDGE
jgi:hypothetical protein